MIRLSKLTDYGIVLLSYVAQRSLGEMITARSLSEESRLPLPTVSKILKMLSRAGLLVSHRGNKGGYTLSRAAADISIADVISAIEGPLALTECSSAAPVLCELEDTCPSRKNWKKINEAVGDALAALTLLDMVRPGFGTCESHQVARAVTEPLLKLVRR